MAIKLNNSGDDETGFSSFGEDFARFGSGSNSGGPASRAIVDYYKDLYSTFDEDYDKNIQKAIDLIPFGMDKGRLSRGASSIGEKARLAHDEIANIALAQGFGDDSGVATAMSNIPVKAGNAKVSQLATQLALVAKNRPRFIAEFLKSIVNPESMSADSIYGIRNSLERYGMDLGNYSAVGNMLGSVDWGSIFNFSSNSNNTDWSGVGGPGVYEDGEAT